MADTSADSSGHSTNGTSSSSTGGSSLRHDDENLLPAVAWTESIRAFSCRYCQWDPSDLGPQKEGEHSISHASLWWEVGPKVQTLYSNLLPKLQTLYSNLLPLKLIFTKKQEPKKYLYYDEILLRVEFQTPPRSLGGWMILAFNTQEVLFVNTSMLKG
jgi:hypothetical protein